MISAYFPSVNAHPRNFNPSTLQSLESNSPETSTPTFSKISDNKKASVLLPADEQPEMAMVNAWFVAIAAMFNI
jgi:hypothetical protein